MISCHREKEADQGRGTSAGHRETERGGTDTDAAAKTDITANTAVTLPVTADAAPELPNVAASHRSVDVAEHQSAGVADPLSKDEAGRGRRW